MVNPTKYVSKGERSIHRFDHRKERLRQHIKEALGGCSSLQQFELKMNERGYEIIKGRGICFADEKKVKFRGSQVSYSLETIERILENQRLFYTFKNGNHSYQNTILNKEAPSKENFCWANRKEPEIQFIRSSIHFGRMKI